MSTDTAGAPRRRILLVDADAFYVAVARLADPEGAGKAPLLIVGGAPGSRGVVCSASYETRKFGVRSAMPISRAIRLCPQAMCVPVPRRACSRKSREIAGVLERFAPLVECASIDEWYLDLSGTEALYHGAPLAVIAERVRAAVTDATGLTVSVGAGTTKLVAKLAVEVAKPKPGSGATGVHVVEPGDEERFLARFRLEDIPLVGPRFRERLERLGMRTVLDVLAYDLPTLQRWLGDREGSWLFDRVRGIDGSGVEPRDSPKSISREETFEQDQTTDESLEEELLRLTVRAASDLRSQGLRTRTVSVKLRDADFTTRQASRTLPEAVVADRVLFETARELLRRLRRSRRTPARLLGIALSSLVDGDAPGQLPLFDDPASASTETARDRALAEAVDRLRSKFGRDVIVPARLSGK